jgi:uncharacterized membrane protein
MKNKSSTINLISKHNITSKTIVVLSLLVAMALLICFSNINYASAETNSSPTPTSTSPTPNFSMSVSPTYFTVLAGNPQTSTIKLNSISRYNGTVNLSATSTNSAITPKLALTSLSVKYNQSPVTTITMTIPGTVGSGQYNVILTAKSSDGSLIHSSSISIQVINPNFRLSASPSCFTVVAGTTVTSNLKVSPIQRFNGTIYLSSSAETGVTANLASHSVSIKYNQSTTITISLSVPTTAEAGKYNVVVTGQNSDGSLMHSINICLQVIKPDFSINASPSSSSIVSGQTGTSLIRLYSQSRFNGTISLTAQSPSGWANLVFAQTSLKLTYGSIASSMVTISVPPQTSSGQYTLTITGKSDSGISHSTTLNIQVLNPNFSMWASPTSLSIVAGTQAATTVNLHPINRFNGSVTLTASTPKGWDQPAFLTNPVTINFAQGASTPLTISIPSGTTSGQYTVTVTGTSGSITNSIKLNVQVLNPNFNLQASPTNMYLIAGTSGTSTITLSPTNRFNGTVTLTVQAPSGWTTPTFLTSPLVVNYAHSSSTIMAITVPTGTFDGKYTLTVTGTSGGLTHSATITVQVITPNIALQSSPSLVTIPAGSAGNITVGVSALGRYNGTITLSATVPNSWTTTFYHPTFAVAFNHTYGSSKLQIAVPTGTAPGKYTMQITATGDQLSLTDTISATVIVK